MEVLGIFEMTLSLAVNFKTTLANSSVVRNAQDGLSDSYNRINWRVDST